MLRLNFLAIAQPVRIQKMVQYKPQLAQFLTSRDICTSACHRQARHTALTMFAWRRFVHHDALRATASPERLAGLSTTAAACLQALWTRPSCAAGERKGCSFVCVRPLNKLVRRTRAPRRGRGDPQSGSLNLAARSSCFAAADKR